MKVTVENQSSVKKVLHIEMPEEVVGRELDSAYNEIKKTAKIKGFRPGKTPRSVLEGMYRKDVHADVSAKLIQEGFIEALKQTQLNIVGWPQVDPPELKEKSAYAFDAEVEVQPEIADIDFKGLSLTRNAYEVSEAEIDMQLSMLQRNKAQQHKIETDRPLQSGDVAMIDYEGFKDGQPYAPTQRTENFVVNIGEGRVVKDLEDGLVGMTPGEEKEIDVTFPDDYFSADIAGQKVLFKVKLNEIKEEILPELNDAFAKGIGDRFQSLSELKDTIRENLKSGYEKRSEQELNEQIFSHLLSQSEFEVPESMVTSELEHIVKDAEQSFEYSNKTMEELGLTAESMADKYRPVAEKQVRRHLILSKLIDQESLVLTDDELEQGLEQMAKNYGQPVASLKAFYDKDPKSMNFFKHTLLEKKALKIIIDNSTIETVEPEKEASSEQAE